MNLRNAVFAGLGLLSLLLGATFSAQAQSSTAVAQPPLGGAKLSSSLGGPITPTQPNFFAESTAPVSPASLNQTLDGSFANQPIPASSSEPAAPLVDDPPRPSKGGIINIKTD